jgi:colicin import membrane protein
MATEEKVNKVKKPFYKKWWVWLIAIIIIGSIATSGEEPTETVAEPEVKETEVKEVTEDQPKEEPVATEPVAEEPKEEVKEEPAKEEPKEPELTLSQQNAINKANDYLDFTAFSKSGLIEQLEFDGFPTDEATFAVNNITVDWKEQAGIKAKDYLDFTSFSRQGLIEQLEFDGFSTEEATYGVDQVGL